MNSKKIVVVGSSNTDMVVKADRLPVPGETVLGGNFMMNPGGKGANQAVTIARLGGDVSFITKTGNDLFGKQSIEMFNQENIHTDYVFSDANNPSGVALIMVDENGENCIVVASGANGTLSPADIDKARSLIECAGVLLMQLEVPVNTLEYAAKFAFEKGVQVILNPAPAAFLSDSFLKCVSIIVPNKTEAEVLSGVKIDGWDTARRAAKMISDKGIENVIVTLGSEGALIKEGENFYEVPVEKIKAVDTTAAGDTFCGALCVALSEGKSLLEAVKFANKAAGITVTRAGAMSSIPYRNELFL
ncbi:MAG: ribokinase [Bacteroidales bacterium]|jgi:ribokinase|nr:ribokinase [Bacteroidales bacterium]